MIKALCQWTLNSVGVICLTACVATPPQEVGAGDTSYPKLSLEGRPWQMRGKATVTWETDAQNLAFNWQHENALTDTVRLSGPTGIGGITVVRRDNIVTWNDGKGPHPLEQLSVNSTFGNILHELPLDEIAGTLIGQPAASNSWSSEVVTWQVLAGFRVPRILEWSLREARARVIITSVEVLGDEST
jgi:outer membrane biogenesis lipoprotein LolB